MATFSDRFRNTWRLGVSAAVVRLKLNPELDCEFSAARVSTLHDDNSQQNTLPITLICIPTNCQPGKSLASERARLFWVSRAETVNEWTDLLANVYVFQWFIVGPFPLGTVTGDWKFLRRGCLVPLERQNGEQRGRFSGNIKSTCAGYQALHCRAQKKSKHSVYVHFSFLSYLKELKKTATFTIITLSFRLIPNKPHFRNWWKYVNRINAFQKISESPNVNGYCVLFLPCSVIQQNQFSYYHHYDDTTCKTAPS